MNCSIVLRIVDSRCFTHSAGCDRQRFQIAPLLGVKTAVQDPGTGPLICFGRGSGERQDLWGAGMREEFNSGERSFR
jgi:hypothetical protein